MKVLCYLSICLFLFSCSNSNKAINKQLLAEQFDTSKKVKTNFFFEDTFLQQALRVIWMNDSTILVTIKPYRKGSDTFPDFSTGLINSHYRENPEIFEDENEETYSMAQYIAEDERSDIYVSVKIELDTSFAVLDSWKPNDGKSNLIFGKKMMRKK